MWWGFYKNLGFLRINSFESKSIMAETSHNEEGNLSSSPAIHFSSSFIRKRIDTLVPSISKNCVS